MPNASFEPALMLGRVARSIHMRTTAIGCRKQTSNSRSFFTVRNLPPAPADNPRDDGADDNQPGRGPLMTAGNGGADAPARRVSDVRAVLQPARRGAGPAGRPPGPGCGGQGFLQARPRVGDHPYP